MLWLILHADPDIPIGSAIVSDEAKRPPVVDHHLYSIVYRTCRIFDAMEVGLWLQHGSQCGCRNRAKPPLELVQLLEISKAKKALGGLARFDRGVDCDGNESGATGFPAVLGHD